MRPKVAFLTMEMLVPDLPEPQCGANFRGGLGILSGDIMAGLPDVKIDGVGFCPLYHRPWFNRNLELSYDNCSAVSQRIVVDIYGRDYIVYGRNLRHRKNQLIYGLECPEIWDVLYTEDRRKRLLQEILMAKAVRKVLKITNFIPDVAWLNESHTALFIALLRSDSIFAKTKSLFTIHTPEHAGMERFYDYRFEGLGVDFNQYSQIFIKNDVLDFTWAAMVLADMVNAVSQEHCCVTRDMFPQFSSKITGIRNGIDSNFWMYPELAGFVRDKNEITISALLEIHRKARLHALSFINHQNGLKLESDTKPTAWFVRRLAAYKNLHPILVESGVLFAACADRGVSVSTPLGQLDGLGMQIVGAGMAAETDNTCLWWMSEFNRIAREALPGRFIFLPKYSLELLRIGAWGSDVWLVTPEPKREACGTSDQRAVINGIPVITTKTGGMAEYIQEFNPENGEGNGFFIDPYNARTLYEKLKLFSNFWYKWHNDNGDNPYSRLKLNAFNSGRALDIRLTLKKYRRLFIKLIK